MKIPLRFIYEQEIHKDTVDALHGSWYNMAIAITETDLYFNKIFSLHELMSGELAIATQRKRKP